MPYPLLMVLIIDQVNYSVPAKAGVYASTGLKIILSQRYGTHAIKNDIFVRI